MGEDVWLSNMAATEAARRALRRVIHTGKAKGTEAEIVAAIAAGMRLKVGGGENGNTVR